MQAPALQTFGLAHATEAPHVPVLLQVCTVLPEHWRAPGAQTPVHAPPTHAELMQEAAVPHCPAALQVSTPLAEHCVVPGMQTPVQTPLTQA